MLVQCGSQPCWAPILKLPGSSEGCWDSQLQGMGIERVQVCGRSSSLHPTLGLPVQTLGWEPIFLFFPEPWRPLIKMQASKQSLGPPAMKPCCVKCHQTVFSHLSSSKRSSESGPPAPKPYCGVSHTHTPKPLAEVMGVPSLWKNHIKRKQNDQGQVSSGDHLGKTCRSKKPLFS